MVCTKWRVIVCNTDSGSFEYPWVTQAWIPRIHHVLDPHPDWNGIIEKMMVNTQTLLSSTIRDLMKRGGVRCLVNSHSSIKTEGYS